MEMLIELRISVLPFLLMVMMYLGETPAFPISQHCLAASHVEDLHANALVPLMAEAFPFSVFSPVWNVEEMKLEAEQPCCNHEARG